MNYLDKILKEIRSIKNESIGDIVTETNVKVIDDQKIFFWMRIYLKEKIDVIEGDEFIMKYLPSGENLTVKFICYGKKNILKDHDDEIVNYDPEDDEKVLCLMVNENEINTRNDIPFIRTLFKTSRFYDYQIIRRSDLTFTNIRTNETPEYIDCDF